MIHPSAKPEQEADVLLKERQMGRSTLTLTERCTSAGNLMLLVATKAASMRALGMKGTVQNSANYDSASCVI